MLLDLILILTTSLCSFTEAALQNGNFEASSLSPWSCNGCRGTVSHDSFDGKQSFMVSHRKAGWSGIQGTATVTGNQYYYFKAHLKLLNLAPGHLYHAVSVKFQYTLNNHVHYARISYSSMQQLNVGWQEVGGDLYIPNGVNSIKVYVEIPENSVNYLFDGASLQQISKNLNWKAEANKRIEQIRKAPLNIRFENHGNTDTSNLKVEIKQMKSSFAFGTAVRADIMMDPNAKAYHDFVYNNFEWAVIANNLKWRLMEFTKGHPIWRRGIPALDLLRSKGMKVRGHNMFWGVESHCPVWIRNMSSSDLQSSMHARIHGMTIHTTGKVEHWDVNNENLHGDFFESHTKNPNITMNMFRWMHQKDPNFKLFLNEYNVVMDSSVTTAYKNQGQMFKDSGIPIYGLGVQSHFHSLPGSMDVLKYRVDKLAEAKLPLWITELSVHELDENKKASALEDVMTLYFSHPAVEGILLWGFQKDAIHDHGAALTSGSNVTPNAAGRKYEELFHKTWRTNEVHSVQHPVNVNGFLGEYQLNLLNHNKVIHTETIHLTNKGTTATFHISGTGSGLHVSQVAFG